jgi:hypothetical protein
MAKGKERIRERGGMLAGMVHGMVKFWLSTGFNHQGKYMASCRRHRGAIIISEPKWFRLKSAGQNHVCSIQKVACQVLDSMAA